MADKPVFTGRMRTPKQFEVARIDFTTEECESHKAWAIANDGIVSISVKESKSGKQYLAIDTYHKNIPEQFGGEQQQQSQSQEPKVYKPTYQPNKQYGSQDRPPSMPMDNGENDSSIPF